MNRIALALIFGGGVLLTLAFWDSAPAAPTPALIRVSDADVSLIESLTPLAADVEQETNRLREKLASPPPPSVPTRDPFRFGRRRETVPFAPRPVEGAAPVEPPAAPRIVLPLLIAVLVEEGDAASSIKVRTAVVTVATDMRFLKVGDTVGSLLVREIGADSLELFDPATLTPYRIKLR